MADTDRYATVVINLDGGDGEILAAWDMPSEKDAEDLARRLERGMGMDEDAPWDPDFMETRVIKIQPAPTGVVAALTEVRAQFTGESEDGE